LPEADEVARRVADPGDASIAFGDGGLHDLSAVLGRVRHRAVEIVHVDDGCDAGF